MPSMYYLFYFFHLLTGTFFNHEMGIKNDLLQKARVLQDHDELQRG